METTIHPSPLQRAIVLADGVAPLAKACGVSANAIYKWLKVGHPPSPMRCAQVETAVGGKVSRLELLPPDFIAPIKTKRATK